MKSLLSWFLLIVSIAVLVSSCAKSDDSKTATTDNSSSSSVNCNNGCFVAVGYSGNIVRSSDNGASWNNSTSPSAITLQAVTFGNNTFVGVGRF